MMKHSEVIINPNGSIYHLGIGPEHLSDDIITVGDPDRVAMVSKFFDSGPDMIVQKREFVTHKGTFRGKPITVVSSGIGVDNTEILLTELDIVANYDLTTRELLPRRRSLNFYRIGTSGSLQEDVKVGSFLVSRKAIGLDNLLSFYNFQTADEDKAIEDSFRVAIGNRLHCYAISPSSELLDLFNDLQGGITITTPGFYAPQGREVRASLIHKNILDDISAFECQDQRVTNFEMETAFIYGLSAILQHNSISLNAILANRVTGEFAGNTSAIVEELILLSLDRIASF